MRIENIRQWQWIVLSLVLGACIGAIRQWMLADLESRFGDPINTQAHFEDALTRIVAGRPCFDNVHVYAASVPDRKGSAKAAHIVSGDYFNGRFQQSAGVLKAEWHPAFFIADIPYRPKTNLDALHRPDLTGPFRAIANPTVVDFLDLLARAKGTHYTRASLMDIGIFGWMACSFVVVGVIWPIVINLMVFGSLRRPAEEKGIDLSKVKPAPAPAAAPPVEEDLAMLNQFEAALETEQAEETAIPAPPLATPEPIKPLVATPLEPLAVPVPRDETEFAAAQEDYYPTAKGAPKKDPSHRAKS